MHSRSLTGQKDIPRHRTRVRVVELIKHTGDLGAVLVQPVMNSPGVGDWVVAVSLRHQEDLAKLLATMILFSVTH